MKPQNQTSSPPAQTGPGGSGTSMGDTLSDTKNTLVQSARDTAAKVKSAVTDTATRAKDEAGRMAMEKKDLAANRIGTYSSAIHDSAKSLEGKDPNIAWLTHRAADKIDQVAAYLRTRDLNGLRCDAEDMARRHPGVFFGSMFLAGLILGNVVKASRRKLDERGEPGKTSDGRGDGNGDESYGSYRDPNVALHSGLTDAPRTSGGI